MNFSSKTVVATCAMLFLCHSMSFGMKKKMNNEPQTTQQQKKKQQRKDTTTLISAAIGGFFEKSDEWGERYDNIVKRNGLLDQKIKDARSVKNEIKQDVKEVIRYGCTGIGGTVLIVALAIITYQNLWKLMNPEKASIKLSSVMRTN